MSRSLADTSLTTCSPIRIAPAVGRSRPAIIRSAVVLPHPEEPTRIMNSPSWTSSERSSTATAPPSKRLVTDSKLTLGIRVLLFHLGGSRILNETELRDQEHHEHRDLTHHRAGHEQVPLGVMRALQRGQSELQRIPRRRVDDDQRPQ